MPPVRTRSDDFLELVRRSRQGRLKVFLGPAAGVGKTYRMLQEAHQLKKRGVDVVIGVIDTHGRAETAALMDGLPQVPLRKVEYRGVELVELDVDAVKKRAPEIALVDELAHTNAPGSKNKKRYEDILELLRAGINVYCAFNIQHLESLNDIVKKATGVKVHETVPDSFLRRADQIVNIDLPPDDLLERLESGKVYPEERIDWALRHFFRVENLEALRELALREVAESIGRSHSNGANAALDQKDGQRATGGRLMLCLSSRSPRAHVLLRRASRMAGRLNVHWYAVYVETPRESPRRIEAATQRHLFDAQQMARDLGAEVHHIKAEDPVEGILEFARANGVTDILIGVSEKSWLKQILGATVPQRLLRKARGFDLHLFSAEEQKP
jgi:two-component system, OmpR family, sensor histidine kinase KdpD